jgi:hypothetical protein
VVSYPVSAISVKFRPCWVTFRTKSTTWELVWGMAMLKTPWRADRETEMFMSVHSLADARLERAAKRRRGRRYISESRNEEGHEIPYCMNWERVEVLFYNHILVPEPRPWFRVNLSCNSLPAACTGKISGRAP